MDDTIKVASERQAYIMQNEEAWRNYWSLRMAEHDRISGLNWAREEGIEKGLERGREDKGREIAMNALAKGLPPELVQEITGLDLETIKGLNS